MYIVSLLGDNLSVLTSATGRELFFVLFRVPTYVHLPRPFFRRGLRRMMAARSVGFRHLHLDVIDEPQFRQLTKPGPPKTPGHAVGNPKPTLPTPPIRGFGARIRFFYHERKDIFLFFSTRLVCYTAGNRSRVLSFDIHPNLPLGHQEID